MASLCSLQNKAKSLNKINSKPFMELGGRINMKHFGVQIPRFGGIDFWLLIRDALTSNPWS
jgi:hypothetical protein